MTPETSITVFTVIPNVAPSSLLANPRLPRLFAVDSVDPRYIISRLLPFVSGSIPWALPACCSQLGTNVSLASGTDGKFSRDDEQDGAHCWLIGGGGQSMLLLLGIPWAFL